MSFMPTSASVYVRARVFYSEEWTVYVCRFDKSRSPSNDLKDTPCFLYLLIFQIIGNYF